jgi:hypothetical protein
MPHIDISFFLEMVVHQMSNVKAMQTYQANIPIQLSDQGSAFISHEVGSQRIP